MSDTHERWINRLCRTWPDGIAASDHTKPGEQPWPETHYPDGSVKQCLHCRSYVALSGPLGADWGGCSNEASQYDGQLVFEHWTCKFYKSDISE